MDKKNAIQVNIQHLVFFNYKIFIQAAVNSRITHEKVSTFLFLYSVH